MGIAHTATVLGLTHLPPSSKSILLVMSIAADWQGKGTLTNDQIATMTGLSTRTVRDHVPQLYTQRLIERRAFDADYQLTLPVSAFGQ